MRRILLVAGAMALVVGGLTYWLYANATKPDPIQEREGKPMDNKKVIKSDEEWKKELSAEEFQVTRRHGTERAFTGRYWNSKGDGIYGCVCCDQPLFDSRTKYDSGTGWPSYWRPVSDEAVSLKTDRGFFMVRTEVLCSRCDAHLGHVFEDGPQPTGQRYCMNSAALRFVPREEKPDE